MTSASNNSSFRGQWIAFFILGTINNLAYVVVLSAGQSLADRFDAAKYLGLITWANVGLGFVARAINTWFLTNTSYLSRILFNCLVYTVGLLGVSFAPSFTLCISAIVVLGCASSFGESVLLGFCKQFDSDLVAGWSSGTGLAGVMGTVMYLVMSIKLTDSQIFLILCACVPIYFSAFWYLHRQENLAFNALSGSVNIDNTSTQSATRALADGDDSELIHQTGNLHTEDAVPLLHQQDLDAESESAGKKSSVWMESKAAMKRVSFLAIQLMLVYWFEYLVSTGCAHSANSDCASQKNAADCGKFSDVCTFVFEDNNPGKCEFKTGSVNLWVKAHSYQILSFCYQAGVLISRSSLQWFKIRRVEILTVLQGLNLALWLAQDELRFLSIWVQFPLMVFVGLLGGASYVNTFYILLNQAGVSEYQKELGINVTALFINFGIVAAASTNLVLYATVLKNTV